ncbi:Panacea domain-containing protein [Micromonospora sp. NPDC050417]|uniref:Panacea domain-containing protein n=1 Tax=Micromonospora sp. NPDC050417 TaxID=3364280 RepID=UPI003788D205
MTQPSASPRTITAYLATLRLARERGYIITRLKMAKLLYLADLAAIRKGDDPISGVEWKWLNHGPFNNALQFLENDLARDGIVQLDPYYFGFQVRLVGDLPGYDMPPEELAVLEGILSEFGNVAASSLKDLSYQTPPMVDALQRGQGVVLDLSLVRPRPRLAGLTRRMSAVLRRLPEQETDPGVFQEIEREMDELANARRRATGDLVVDD